MTWPNAAEILPDDAESATLVGRAWVPDVSGPSVVVLRGGRRRGRLGGVPDDARPHRVR